MKIAVYDTYVQCPDGLRMHFDIFVNAEMQDLPTILGYGRIYLASKGLPTEILRAEKCNYCHIETANPAVQKMIEEKGFAILEMETCK